MNIYHQNEVFFKILSSSMKINLSLANLIKQRTFNYCTTNPFILKKNTIIDEI